MNLPNLLSFARIFLLIPLYFLAFQKNNELFAFFFLLTALTDFLDGFIARKFKLETEFGAKLDSIADRLFYFSIIAWSWLLISEFITKNSFLISLILGALFATEIFKLLKFGNLGYFHLYSAKACALTIFLFFFSAVLQLNITNIMFYIMSAVIILHCLEETLLTILINKSKINVKSIFHYLEWLK